MAIRNYNDALEALAEITSENKQKLKQGSNQRRSQVVDIFGQEYTRIGKSISGSTYKRATIHISVSPDIIYLERFQFKIFVIDSDNAKHWDIKIEGIDITPYLREQAERKGRWLDGSEGVFPSKDLDTGQNISDSFDLIEVAHTMYAEGRYNDAEKILRSGLKKVVIEADDDFDISLLLYLKYSHLNR